MINAFRKLQNKVACPFGRMIRFGVVTVVFCLTSQRVQCDGGTRTARTQDPRRFQVWAPNAEHAWVRGTFNGWDLANPLSRLEGGHWSGFVPQAAFGDSYKFYFQRGAADTWRPDPYGECLDGSGHSLIYDREAYVWTDQNFVIPPLGQLVIYELNIDGYSRTANPGQGGLSGTFLDCIDRLDYLAQLGVNAVEIMPVVEFGSATSWGYNPCLPFSIERNYGSPDDFKSLVDECHRRGIAVILDVVYNHWSVCDDDENLWCYDVGDSNIYFYSETCERSGAAAANPPSGSGANDPQCDLWNTPWDPRPYFGYNPREVRWYIRDNVINWLEEYHIDGLRWDSTKMIRNSDRSFGMSSSCDITEGWTLMEWINNEMRRVKPGAFSIAEDLSNDARVTQPVSRYGGGFDSQFYGGVGWALRGNILSSSPSMAEISLAIQYRFNDNVNERLISTEDHDIVGCINGHKRLAQDIADTYHLPIGSQKVRKLASFAAALTLTSPGVPMIFIGQEFLAGDCWSEQEPLPWTNVTTYAGMVQLFTDLVSLRENRQGKTAGLMGNNLFVNIPPDEANHILAFNRSDVQSHFALIIANLSDRAWLESDSYYLGVPCTGVWRLYFNSDDPKYDPNFEGVGYQQLEVAEESPPMHGNPHSAHICIGAYSVLVYAWEPPRTPTPAPTGSHTAVPAPTSTPTPTSAPTINAWHIPSNFEACDYNAPMRHQENPNDPTTPVCIYFGVEPAGSAIGGLLYYRVNDGIWCLHHFTYRCHDEPNDYWWTNCDDAQRLWIPGGQCGDRIEYYIAVFNFNLATTYLYDGGSGRTGYEDTARNAPFTFAFPTCTPSPTPPVIPASSASGIGLLGIAAGFIILLALRRQGSGR